MVSVWEYNRCYELISFFESESTSFVNIEFVFRLYAPLHYLAEKYTITRSQPLLRQHRQRVYISVSSHIRWNYCIFLSEETHVCFIYKSKIYCFFPWLFYYIHKFTKKYKYDYGKILNNVRYIRRSWINSDHCYGIIADCVTNRWNLSNITY
jgi:hypothetical protein